MIKEKKKCTSDHFPSFPTYTSRLDEKGVWGTEGKVDQSTRSYFNAGSKDQYTGKVDEHGNITVTKHVGAAPSFYSETYYSYTLVRTFKNPKHQCNVHLDEIAKECPYTIKDSLAIPKKIENDSVISSITEPRKRDKFATTLRNYYVFDNASNFFFWVGLVLFLLGIILTLSATRTLILRYNEIGSLFPEGTSTANIVINIIFLVVRVLAIFVGAFSFYIGYCFKKNKGLRKKLKKKCDQALADIKFKNF